MKKTILILFSAIFALSIYAQTPKNVEYVFTEASDLNLIGKIMDTPNPYHRIDTVAYKGFTKSENRQVRSAAGLAVLFKTNSSTISIKTEFGWEYQAVNTMPVAYRGYDLYIKKDGDWLYANSWAVAHGKSDQNLVLMKDMDRTEKECLLYLPIYSELLSVQIGVEKGATIEYLESPFRHKIAIWGSSYTHGISTTRAGMSYPMQLMRWTGLQFTSMATSGNCKMQPYFADVLVDVEADAYVFDAFSNPDAKMINKRLFPFIERMTKAHPGKPIIFIRSIYREKRNFNLSTEESERAKMEMADSLMKIAVKKYPDVYYIKTSNATCPMHETSVDGTHPNDYGYTLWAQSIKKPLLKILKKYGIK